MKCPKCNHEYSDDLSVCPICGEPRHAEQPGPQAPPQRAVFADRAHDDKKASGAYQSQPVSYPPAVPAPGDSRRSCGTPLVLGILSLIIPYAGLVLGILALVFGNGVKKDYPRQSAEYAMGNAGWVLGIIGLVFQALLIIWISFVMTIVVSALSAAAYSYDMPYFSYFG